MSYTKNSLTLYMRPMASIPPYQVNNCAKWLVQRGQFKDFLQAKLWLINQEQTEPWNYRAILAEYFDATDYQSDYKSKRDVNKYRSTQSNYYGEDAHMWYSSQYTPKQWVGQLEYGIREWPSKNKADTRLYTPIVNPRPNVPQKVLLRAPPGQSYLDNQGTMGFLLDKKY